MLDTDLWNLESRKRLESRLFNLYEMAIELDKTEWGVRKVDRIDKILIGLTGSLLQMVRDNARD